jgi:hypothetical protein
MSDDNEIVNNNNEALEGEVIVNNSGQSLITAHNVPTRARDSDGGVYLVISDDSPEFEVALRYAAQQAHVNRGHVAVLHVISIDDFQHWSSIEERMRKELREQAEKHIWNTAKRINEMNNMLPAMYIGEGERTQVILDLIDGDKMIRSLILGGSSHHSGPGALISYFTGKGLNKLRVPVIVVPGHYGEDTDDAIA